MRGDFKIDAWGQRMTPASGTPIRQQGESWIACELDAAEAIYLGDGHARPLGVARVMRVLGHHDREAIGVAGYTGSTVCLPSLALQAAMRDIMAGKDYYE